MDKSEGVEYKTDIDQFLGVDEMFPMQNYEGIPEFDIGNRDLYKVENDEDLPALIFQNPTDPEELPVLPPEHSYTY